MFKYNFKSRSLETIFDKVTHIVGSYNFSKFSDYIDHYEIVKYKETIALAIKAEAIEEFIILNLYDNQTQGRCSINGKICAFSIQEDGKYIYVSQTL